MHPGTLEDSRYTLTLALDADEDWEPLDVTEKDPRAQEKGSDRFVVKV